MVADYTGTTHGRLSVVSRAGSSEDGRAVWICRCECGEPVLATSKQLTKGHKRGCVNCQDSGSRSSIQVRLMKYVVSDSGCWNWTGKQNANGYGAVRVDGAYTRAHRAMFFMLNPLADRGKIVMHTCDNPQCVNPAHLQLGTQKENMMDMHLKGRFRGGAKAGNKNALGNKGWRKGGITAKYASKLGDEVELPEELK